VDGGRDRWVCLDVGETIVEETRFWTAWAAELDVPLMTFMAVFGAVVERGLEHHHVFDSFPGRDWRAARPAVDARVGGFQPVDLYPDALPAIASLRASGYRVAIVGNQPARRTAELRALGFDAEVMAMSEEMGVAKPQAAFFDRVVAMLGVADASDAAYVGDRIDNDILPAAAAGMRAVWLRRGPWGLIPRHAPREAALVVTSLEELSRRAHEAWAVPRG
jgi:HAD superfamily hydrolase (TIGR01662 family)